MRPAGQGGLAAGARHGRSATLSLAVTIDPATGLAGLAISAFLSSTLLPGSSELVLAAFVALRPDQHWPAVAVATLANTLGGMTSYAIGRMLPASRQRPRALRLAQRHGVAVLLLSWLPVVGDALCVASGWLRHNAAAAALAMATGKLARYIVVAAGAQLLSG